MFSQVSVNLFLWPGGGRGVGISDTRSHVGVVGIERERVDILVGVGIHRGYPRCKYTQGINIQGVDIPRPVGILTCSGGHQNTYGWQAGGTHPTGRLSANEVV